MALRAARVPWKSSVAMYFPPSAPINSGTRRPLDHAYPLMALSTTRQPFSEQGPFHYLALSGMAPCCSSDTAARPLGAVGMHRHDKRPATLQFRGTETCTPTPAPPPPIGGGSEPGRRRNSRLEAELEVLPIILQLTSDTSRTASAWSLTYLVFM